MSDFLDQLRGSGRLHKLGEFTIDTESAASKLARFQLQDKKDFLYHLVGGLFRIGAAGMDVITEPGKLTLKFTSLKLPKAVLETLNDALLDEAKPQRRLAIAAQSLLNEGPSRFDWIGSKPGQVYDYIADNGKNWGAVELKELQVEGLPTKLLSRALAALKKCANYCRRPLSIQGIPITPYTPKQKLAGLPAYYSHINQSGGSLSLVVDEMEAPVKTLATEIPWHGVCWGNFTLDASMTNVVEDQLYQRVLESVPSTYCECILDSLSQPITQLEDDTRLSLTTLLGQPQPTWLSMPVKQALLNVALFKDLQDKLWSVKALQNLNAPFFITNKWLKTDLSQVILVEASVPIQQCLQDLFPGQCQKLDEVILRSLRRQQNIERLNSKPTVKPGLPVRNWLVQRDYQQSLGKWWVGIPDDWSETGGQVTIVFQEHILCNFRIEHAEITFIVVAEVSESQINEVFDALTDEALKALKLRWLYCANELMQELSGSNITEATSQNFLIRYLSRIASPQNNYFAKTLLFQDWYGRMYSLSQLLELKRDQVIGLVSANQQPIPDWAPAGVYLRQSRWLPDLLNKISDLKILDFKHVLSDLQAARQQKSQATTLYPEFALATLHFCIKGTWLAPIKVKASVAFEAWVKNDDLQYTVMPNNQPLGLNRFRLVLNNNSQEVIQALNREALQLPLPEPLTTEWLEFARQANIRNLGWTDIACWPTAQNRLLSLEDLKKLSQIDWTTGPGSADHCSELLLINLTPTQQKSLQQNIGGQWCCQDSWFSEKERLQKFLANPLWKPKFSEILAVQPGMWLSANLTVGQVYWLYQGRLLETQEGIVPSGIAAAVECPNMSERPGAGLTKSAAGLILQWLSQAHVKHASLLCHWKNWESLNEQIFKALRHQPWFTTNLGPKSWEELLGQATLYRVEQLPPEDFPEQVLLQTNNLPGDLLDRLAAEHPDCYNSQRSKQFLQTLREKKLLDKVRKAQEHELQRLIYTTTFSYGKLALSGKKTKDCWLLTGSQSLPISNLATGIVGYIETKEYRSKRQGSELVAELNIGFRRNLYNDLLVMLQKRLQFGRLNSNEIECFCEILLVESQGQLSDLRWIPCADNSLTSLSQLQLLAKEHQGLVYWPRNYPFFKGDSKVIPILSHPLLLELVRRHSRYKLECLPPPLPYQDIKLPSLSGVGKVLSTWGQTVEHNLRQGLIGIETRRAALFGVITSFSKKLSLSSQSPAIEDNRHDRASSTGSDDLVLQYKGLLKALRRNCQQLLIGPTRKEMLKVLEKAQIGYCDNLWSLKDGQLVLSHSALQQLSCFQHEEEPPIPVVLSLLLALVAAVNIESDPFTDKMEEDFLSSLIAEVVACWASSKKV